MPVKLEACATIWDWKRHSIILAIFNYFFGGIFVFMIYIYPIVFLGWFSVNLLEFGSFLYGESNASMSLGMGFIRHRFCLV